MAIFEHEEINSARKDIFSLRFIAHCRHITVGDMRVGKNSE